MERSPDEHIRFHKDPRISANDLARYMVAGEVGRKGIIRRAREMSSAVAVKYSDARSTLRAALCDPVNEKRIVANAKNMLEQKAEDASRSDWVKDDALKSIDVLDSFSRMQNSFMGFDFIAAPTPQPFLVIGGVSVSVNCDILIHRDMKTKPSKGAALFRLTKPEEDETEAAKSKREEMGAYAATLVHMHVVKNLVDNRTPHHELCWSVDVQCSEIHSAPRTYKNKANNLEAACEFIAAMWDRV